MKDEAKANAADHHPGLWPAVKGSSITCTKAVPRSTRNSQREGRAEPNGFSDQRKMSCRRPSPSRTHTALSSHTPTVQSNLSSYKKNAGLKINIF